VSESSPSDDEHFEIRAILNDRFRNGRLEYHVQWKVDSSKSWVSASDIDDTAAVTRYFREKEAKKRRRSLGRR
jgi:hypothetical protein